MDGTWKRQLIQKIPSGSICSLTLKIFLIRGLGHFALLSVGGSSAVCGLERCVQCSWTTKVDLGVCQHWVSLKWKEPLGEKVLGESRRWGELFCARVRNVSRRHLCIFFPQLASFEIVQGCNQDQWGSLPLWDQLLPTCKKNVSYCFDMLDVVVEMFDFPKGVGGLLSVEELRKFGVWLMAEEWNFVCRYMIRMIKRDEALPSTTVCEDAMLTNQALICFTGHEAPGVWVWHRTSTLSEDWQGRSRREGKVMCQVTTWRRRCWGRLQRPSTLWSFSSLHAGVLLFLLTPHLNNTNKLTSFDGLTLLPISVAIDYFKKVSTAKMFDQSNKDDSLRSWLSPGQGEVWFIKVSNPSCHYIRCSDCLLCDSYIPSLIIYCTLKTSE